MLCNNWCLVLVHFSFIAIIILFNIIQPLNVLKYQNKTFNKCVKAITICSTLIWIIQHQQQEDLSLFLLFIISQQGIIVKVHFCSTSVQNNYQKHLHIKVLKRKLNILWQHLTCLSITFIDVNVEPLIWKRRPDVTTLLCFCNMKSLILYRLQLVD